MKAILFIGAMFVCLASFGQSVTNSKDKLKKELQAKPNDKSSLQPEQYTATVTQLNKFLSQGVAFIQTYDNRYEGVQGSPYLNDGWIKGAVLLTGFDNPMVALLNYDCVNGQLVFRHEDGIPAGLDKEVVSSFMFEDADSPEGIRYFISLKDEKSKIAFYEVLHNGKNILLEHNRKVLKKADYQRAYNPDRRYDEYVPVNELYIMRGKEQPEKVKLNRKSVTAMFPGQTNQVNEFIDSNNLKFKDKKELVSLLRHLDTL